MPGRLFYGFEAEELLDPQPPIEGESLLSWVARNTIENDLPNITTILRDVGQIHRNKMADVMRKDIDVEGLAVILGSDGATVRSLRGDDVGDGRMRYLGALVRYGDVHTATRRFAPAALRRDEIPFYRASWLIRTFPADPKTWQLLRFDCDCGAAQTWATVSTTVLCENCGGDLRDLEADEVPADARPGLGYLADILFGTTCRRSDAMARLPPKLRALDPGDVYELALLMARVVDHSLGHPRKSVWRGEPRRLAVALAKAAELLPSWPETPWLALACAGDTKRMHPRSDPLIALHCVLSGEWAPNVSAPVARLLDEVHADIALDGTHEPHRLVELNDAARILRMNKREIRAARARGHLGSLFVIRKGEILPGYERSNLEAIATTGRWPAAYTTAKALGLPSYGLEQLCAMDEVLWAKAPHRTVRPGFYIDPASAADLEHRLRSSAGSYDELRDPVPLNAAMRGIGGREKPWGPVIRALLEGEWRYALGHTGHVVREICVECADVAAIRDMTFEPSNWRFPFDVELSQNDACDVLNVPLRSRGCTEPYKVCDRHGAWIFDRNALAELALRVVTSCELGAWHLLPVKTTVARIARADLERLEFGYARDEAIRRFDGLRPRR